MSFADYSQSPKPFWSHPNYKGYDAIAGKPVQAQPYYGKKRIICEHCAGRFEKFEYLLQHHRDKHNEIPDPAHP